MAAPMKFVCLDPFSPDFHPLQAIVSKLQLTEMFSNCVETSCALLLSWQETQPLSKSTVLVCAHVTAKELPECALHNSSSTLAVYVSRTFLSHYSVQEDSSGFARIIQLLPLEKIVIGARTKQSFKWASSEDFSSFLLVLASCPGQTLLVRRGDTLILPHHPLLGDNAMQVRQYLSDLIVLDCTPLTQGMITVNTTVVVSDCRDLLQGYCALDFADCCSIIHRPSSGSLFVSDFAHYANNLGPGSSLLSNRLLFSSGFTEVLQALECRLDVHVTCDSAKLYKLSNLAKKIGKNMEVDMDSSIFVSKNLLLKLGLFNCEWVMAALGKVKRCSGVEGLQSPTENKSATKSIAKPKGDVQLAKIVAFIKSPEMDVGDSTGFISPVLWFNLSNGEATPIGSKCLKIKRWNKPGHKLSASICCSAAPLYAKELHIEAVITADYVTHGPFNNVLFQHFNTPRLVRQGSILAICSQGHPDFMEHGSDGITRWPVLYFKVKQVSGFSVEAEFGSYLADTDHTSLYMRGSTNSLAPCSMSEAASSFWTSLLPPGLSGIVENMVSIIQPHITEKCVNLRRACSVLLMGPDGCGKVTAIRAVCRRLHLHLLKVDCVTLCGDTAAACESKMKAAFHKAEFHHPCVLLLRDLQLLCQRRDSTETDSRVASALCQLVADAHSSIIVVGCVHSQRDLSLDIMPAFVHQVVIERPTEEQRFAMLASLSQDLPLGKDINLTKIAKQTAGFILGDICALLIAAGKAAYRRLLKTYYPHKAGAKEEQDLCVFGVTIIGDDFSTALEDLQEAHSKAIGAPKIPSVKWQDVGGLQHIKKEILDTVQLPLEHPELLSLGLRRSGLLLYGPPGTGKTLLAKAVATECSMTFLSVKGPELINMYVGQSEENIREVFCKARTAAPSIIFFDELDSLAPKRGRSGDSGGVMDRVVSQLLAELDGLHSSSDVFVIGATNRPDLLDQSLLRPGRFDKLVYVGINEDKESQLQVLKAILRKFKVDPGVSLSEIVERLPLQVTGADLYALCSDAMMSAIKRKILHITEGLETEFATPTLCAEDFRQALDILHPSVSEEELHKYKVIQQKLTAK
ncbi:peroxisome biogenesis factor 6 isoform X1 [Silurus asotus]|uniref:Peroxisomal ATPase PEX6 n=1 Tax=Silurus asotus TaxID=30991 RepID=A0AAD5AFA1_SILAS|nr:peroxisome biogenesis factor 6 isoform X1 [Silurus asotus]